MKYSAVILTRNEQHNIAECIGNLQPLANEVIVVDDYSADDTPNIAADLGAIVFQRPLNNNWAEQRDFGMEITASPWVLMVDADERFDSLAHKSLTEFNPINGVRAASFIRRSHFNGRPLNHFRYKGDPQFRALHSNVRYMPTRPVHELPDLVEGETIRLPGQIEHYWHLDTKELFSKWKRYSEIEGRMLAEKSQRPLPVKIVRHLARIPIEQAYLDGWAGIVNVAGEVYGDIIHARARKNAIRELTANNISALPSLLIPN
ncbi:glycosyltransferase family 2 protein [Candidatus Saccharibacteria bacterium]|nr:glycosyltransferase family 2 protein [Candidatus Saccharibacteria bacterium]